MEIQLAESREELGLPPDEPLPAQPGGCWQSLAPAPLLALPVPGTSRDLGFGALSESLSPQGSSLGCENSW